MRLLFIFFILISTNASSQSSFPLLWEGNWKGELLWYKTGAKEPQKVAMELKIHPLKDLDSVMKWSWQIIYGSAGEDSRPYTLIPKDSTGVHWVIDEHNGIVLDQYWVAGKFSGAFTVMNSTIVNTYWMEEDKMMVEFYSFSAKPVSTSGKGTDESPRVDSYKVGSYQKAILKRSH